MNPYKTHGAFSWSELMTTDPEAAREYYSSVFPWTFSEMEMGDDGVYHVAAVGGKPVGGIMKRPNEHIPVHWGYYITVQDVDETVARLKDLGGTVVMEPFDAPGVGRMCPVADPQGAHFSVIAYENTDQERHARSVVDAFTQEGAFSWFELHVPDAKAAEDFYRELFGWTIDWQEMPHGPYGVVKIGDVSIAGIVSSPMENAPPHWASYVTVTDFEAHAGRVADAGGQALMDAITVPTVGTFAYVADPQGAVLAGIQYEPMPEQQES
ncbi:MAG: VOC family protein [Rhodothermales bacterium]|nr:VOC family protein [Rhodothermales bacterium]